LGPNFSRLLGKISSKLRIAGTELRFHNQYTKADSAKPFLAHHSFHADRQLFDADTALCDGAIRRRVSLQIPTSRDGVGTTFAIKSRGTTILEPRIGAHLTVMSAYTAGQLLCKDARTRSVTHGAVASVGQKDMIIVVFSTFETAAKVKEIITAALATFH
jgi:hypothetical protein